MCQTCKDARRYRSGDDSTENTILRQRLLQEIAEKMKSGVSAAHFDRALAILSESELPERNEELEGRWENAYRALRVE